MLTACRSTHMNLTSTTSESDSTGLSGAAALQAVVNTIAGEMATAGYSSIDQAAVRIALREALLNALLHGHGREPGSKLRARWHVGPSLSLSTTLKWVDSPQQVTVNWNVAQERVLIEVDDGGPGFDSKRFTNPKSADKSEPLVGRGVLLMREVMTWVMYNHRGNRVSMWLLRSPE